MPNALALLALLAWPLASFALFRSLGASRGLIAGVFASYLLLPPPPAGLDLPLLPPLTKDTIPGLAALAACLLLYGRGLRLLPENRVARALLAAYFVSPVFTILTNADQLVWGPTVLPGLRLIEVAGVVVNQAAQVAPFLLARALLSQDRDHRDLLWGFVLATLAYSLPMLVEVRLSPQLNTWIYGYFQHSFEQMMRGGGFRPIVFLYHGLWVALLASMAVLAACVLSRTAENRRRGLTLLLAALWLLGVLILCKSLGALIFAVLLAPLVLLGTVRMQVRVAGLVAVLALAYPVARGADLIPAESLIALAERASPERAQSFGFRLDNEMTLLNRAAERPLFGWGIWGRHLIYDRQSGRALTVADGRWIIVLGVAGWSGFLAEFGLLTLPLLAIWWRGGPAPPRLTAGAMILLAANLADLFPNATLTPLTWLFAGALLGWCERRQAALATTPSSRPSRPALAVILGAAPRPRAGAAAGAPMRTVL